MTEEEVQLIYDYLHQNYEYIDGELFRIRKHNQPSRGARKKLGSIFYPVKNSRIIIRATLRINDKNYTCPLSHFIWIFHKKEKPKLIKYFDGNPVNNRIENLAIYNGRERESNKQKKVGCAFKTKSGETRWRYGLDLGNGKKISFGTWKTQQECQELYEFVRDIWTNNQSITPEELKRMAKERFPQSQMKLNKENVCGYPGIYKRGKRFVARIKPASTHDTPEEAYEAYMKAKENYKNGAAST